MGAFIIIILSVIAVSLVANLSSETRTVASGTEPTPSKDQTVSVDTQAGVIDSDTSPLDTVGERTKAVLTQQGIPFTIDDDGELSFEYHFRKYCLSDIDDDGYFCLSAYFEFNADERERDAMLHVANGLHYQMKLVRIVCFADSISFSVESMVSPDTDFQQLLRVSLQLLECAYEESRKHFAEYQGAQTQPASAIGFTAQSTEEKAETATACQSPSIGFNSSRYRE